MIRGALMPLYRVATAYKLVAELPTPHLHLDAIGVNDEHDNESRGSTTWHVDDVLRVQDSARFGVGRVGVTVPIEVGVTLCPTCGQRVLRFFPAEVEQQLISHMA
jgi:hypothetical protein